MSKNTTMTKTAKTPLATKIVAVFMAVLLAFLQVPIKGLSGEALADAVAGAQAQLTGNTSIDVPLTFEHAYITYSDQVIATPATKVTIPVNSELAFTATADSGYQLESVTATIDGKETKLKADEKGVYKLTAAEVAITTNILVKGITEPTVEATEVAVDDLVQLQASDSSALLAQQSTSAASSTAAAEAEESDSLSTQATSSDATVISSDNASVTVAVYPTSADRSARTNALTSDYEVSVSETLYGAVHFDFNPGEGPKSGRLTYTYTMPSNIKTADKAVATLYDDEGNVAGTWEIKGGTVYFYYNESWANAHPNGGGNFNFDFTLDEDVTETGSDSTFSFPGATETITVKVKDAEMVGSKTNAGVDEDGYVTYTVKLTAQADFSTFNFSDHLESSLDYVEGSFTFDGSPLAVTITANSDGTHDAVASMSSITRGDHVITYRTKVDQAEFDKLANWQVLNNTRNTATWKYGNDGELKEGSADSWLWLQKNLVNKWQDGGITDGNKIKWVAQINGSNQFKSDLADYTATDSLGGGLSYEGTYIVYDANWQVYDTGSIPSGATSFTYEFKEDAGSNTYYLVYTTIVNDPSTAQALSNEIVVTPPDGGTPTETSSTYNYDPNAGDSGDGQTIKPDVAKEVEDQSEALSTGVVSWHSTLTSENYPEPEQKSGLVMQYYDSLENWSNKMYVSNSSSGEAYYRIWFVGEPELYANGTKLVKGVDYQFDEQGGNTYGYINYGENFEGESVPVAYRIRFILDSDTMSKVVENKTPIDIYYDTKCDGTYQTYYNEGRARIVSGNAEVYGKSVSETYTLSGDSRTTKTGWMWFDESRGKYVAQWEMIANRADNWDCMTPLTSPYFTFTDTLPEGMSVIEDSIDLWVVRPESSGLEYISVNPSYTFNQNGRTATVTTDLRDVSLQSWQTPFYDESTGQCYAWAQLRFQTELDPAYVVHDGAEQTLRNTVTASSGDQTLGTGQAAVSYTDQVISKTGSQSDGEPVVHYRIEVNTKGQKLDPDSTHTSVNLKDTLDYRSTVVLSSIKVADYKTGEDVTDQCVVTLSNSETDEGGNATSSFTVNVPDGRALVITYDVKLSGTDGQWLEVTNSASLSGITNKQTSSKQWFKVNHADASVYGSNTSIAITKTDSSNVVGDSARLAGAVFELYSVDLSKLPDGDYTAEGLAAASTKVNTVTTDTSGSAVLYDESTKALQYDTLYYFKEVKAPLGYAIDDSNPHFVMTQGSNYEAQSALAASHGIHASPNTTYNVTDTKKTSTLLRARKVFENGELQAGDFTFELREGGKLIETKTNDAEGNVAFTNIEYDAAGTHTYTITEVAGSKDYIDYDARSVTVTVNVVNDGRGSYYAEATYPDGGEEAVFTNTYHATGQAQLAATKTLNGKAPSNGAFSFTLSGADGAIQTVTNDASGAVKFSPLTFDAADIDFDSVDEDGNRYAEFTYTIAENAPAGAKSVVGGKVLKDGMFYDANLHSVTVRVTDDGDGTLEVTYDGDTTFAGASFGNTHETVDVSGVKEWYDEDDQDGIRPTSVTVHLLADGVDTGRSATATADGDWKFAFSGLDKYDANGNTIAYTVSEDAVSGYTAEVTGSVADGFTIANTHTPETTQVPVRKVWDDANNQDGIRNGQVYVNLLADGEATGNRVKLSEKNNWSFTFTDLPKYADGKLINYTIKETTSLKDYEKPVYSTDGETLVVTNTHTPQTTEVSGTKSWQDNGNADGNRPASITVHLLADGTEIDSQAITEAGGWSYSFTGLPVYKAGAVGQEISYSVQEDVPADYAASSVDDGIINTYERDSTSVTVTKAWDDENDKDGVRPEAVTVQLLANGSVYDTQELTAASGWTYTWSDLPKRLNNADATYTVSESAVEGYELVSTVGNPSSGYTLTNKHEPESGDAQLTLIKSSTTNSDARLFGAQFTLTNVNDPANTETVTTDWYGTATFTKLKRGQTYTLQETSAPGGYVLDETVYTFTVSNDAEPTVQCTSGELNVWGGQASYWTWLENQPDSGYGSLIVQKTLVGSDGVWGNVSRHPEIDTVRAGMQVYAVNVDTGDYFTFQSIGNAARYTRKVDLYGSDGSVKGQVTITPSGSMASKIANVPSGTWWVTEYADGMTSFDGDNGAYSGSSDAWTRTTTYKVNGESTQLIGTSNDESQLKTIEITNNYYSNGSLVLSKEFGWEYDNLPGKYAGNLLGGKEEGATGATGTIMTNITFKITGQNLGETYTVKGNGFDKSTPTEIVSESGKTAILVTYTKQQWTITNLPYDTYTVVEQSDGYRDNGEEIDTILHKFYTTGTFEVTKDSATTNVSVGNTTGETAGEGVSESGATVDVDGTDETLNVLNVYYRPKVVEATKTWSIPEGVNYTPQDIEVQLVRSINGVDNEGKWQQGYFYPVTSEDVPEHPGYVTRKTLHWNSETNSYDKVVFSQLPAVTANGEQITYEVREVSADGSLVPMVNGSYTDEDGNVLTDGNTYIAADGTTATATWGDGWSPGKAPYADVDGVSRYYSSDKGLTIVNTLQTTEVEGTKTWNDADNQDGKRPASVTVRLLADGKEVASKSVSAADGWTYDFTGLPMYSNGAEIEYTVTEDAVPGYETTIDGTDITNTHAPEKTTVKGSKTWNDANDQDGARPDSIVVRVFNGTTEVASKTVTPGDDGTWSYEFSGLPKYANGTEITYTVTEDAVADYTTAINGYDITNTHTPETTQVSGKKTWDDADNQDGKRPASITVRLWNGSDEVASTTATAEGNWAYSFTNLPKFANGEKINYTVSEGAVEGYEAIYDGYDISNAYQPETIDLSGSKTWDDEGDQDGKRPSSVTVRLFANDKEIDSVTTTAADKWSYEFTDLPVYENGERIDYEVVEDAVEGYETTYNGFSVINTHAPETTEVSGTKTWNDADDQDGKRPSSITVRLLADGVETDSRTLAPDADGNWPAYSFTDLPVYANGEKINYTISEDAVEGYETSYDGYGVTNTHTPETTEVSGTKTWDDANNQDGKRPASVTVRLYADGEEAGSATATAATNWSYSFTDLPKYADGEEIEYTVSEDAVEGYEASYDGYDVTNTHTPETTEVSGTKTWTDANDQDGKRPASITVRLYADGSEIDSATVSADTNGDWAYSFTDLPVYKNGQRITYTVSEDAVNGYTTAINGYDITNTHTPETTEESGRKAWIDANDQDGARPDKITVRLLADGEEVDHVEAISSNGWAYSFTDLPKYANGSEITYTVVEDAVEDYQTSYEVPATIMNTHSPKKTSVSGVKVWADANNQDGKRPASVTVHLLANGADTGKSVTVTAADDWKYEFTDLDKYANGSEISYTVTEDTVAGYTTTINGYTITNTHVPETTQVSGSKTWADNNDQDGKRPESVTVRLLADGKEVNHAVVDEDSNWSYSFTDLPVYANGERIAYTVQEDEVENYTTTINGTSIVNTHTPERINVSGSKTWSDNGNQDGIRPASVTVRLLADGTEVASTTATAASNWAYSFTNLPKYASGAEIAYTVTEDAVSGYTTEIDGYDITNTHTPETTEISGTKTWSDGNDQDGMRPTSITVNLLADGVEVDEKTVTASNGWSYTFSDLPVFKGGQRIAYTVSEDAVSGYTTAINGFGIANTHTPATTEVSGTKTWADGNNQDGIRPASVTVRLLADGTEVASTTATAESNWAYSFTNLPKYASGTEIAYTVTEDAVSGYTTEIDGYDITNTHTPETTEVSGTKTWNDADDQDGKRPASITVRLLADGTEVDHATVSADEQGNWSYEFTELPVFANGQRISYTISEDAVASYTSAIEGFDVTNTHTPETTQVSGVKDWSDGNNQDGIRPASITVRLLADGEEVDSTTATAAGNWAYSFTDLPKYEAGTEIEYSVVEDAVAGYTPSVEGFDITNTHTPETTEFEGKKVWNDADDQDGIRPESVTVHLLANGADTGKTANATEEGGWSYRFTELDKYANGVAITYSVTEDAVPGYTTSISGSTVTNTHTPETTEVEGTKIWNDANNQDGKRPANITVRLFANGEEVDKTTVSAGADGSWSYRFTDLPKYADGEEIEYTVSEDAVEGYETSYDGYDVTNTHTPETTEVEGTKTWDDAENQDGARPASVTVRLYADGAQVGSATATAATNWSYSFTDLPKYAAGEEIAYTVLEDAVDGYQASYDELNIINTHTPDKTSLSGVKVWADGNDQDGIRPTSVTIHLHANGVDTGKTAVATKDGNWRYSFTDLDKYAEGAEVAYTVTEDVVAGYTTAIEGSTVTNTHTPETTEVAGKKTWNDSNNQDGIRPASITVRLLADGEEVESAVVTAANNWSYSFTDLPKYAAGEEIEYSVEEDAVDGYEASYDGYDIANTHTPETTEVEGAKTWNDADDQDGKRPASITVNLLANGSKVDSATVTSADGWSYSFKNLPAYAAGSKIAYTVVEEAVSGYEASYDGYDVTNTHTPETTSVSGSKTWADHDDQDGARPTSVTVRLYADGEEVASTTASAETNWSYEFTDLPKYAKGEEIDYTIEEDAVAGYGTTYSATSVINTHTPETTEVSGAKTWDDAENQDGARPASVTVRLYADGTQVDSRTVTAATNWSYSFTDLPKYADGEEIEYTVSEDAVEGYEASYDGYDVTNKHTPETTEVEGTKTWDDAENQDGARPASITVRLYADGAQVGSATATAANNWSYSFTDLPKYADGEEIEYSVEEDAVEGYEASYDGYDITNKHTPETTEVEGTKTWDDAENQDGARPASVTVRLYADGTQVGSATATAATNWSYSFTDLPKYADGEEIEYSVEEDAVEGYEASYDGYDVTNTHTPETTKVEGTKTWDDAENQDGARPASITVRLYADGEEAGSTMVTAATNWSYSFTDLPVFKNGQRIVYTLSEDPVEGYDSEVDGFDVTNTHAPEKTTVKVVKEWQDDNDYDGLRPADVSIQLYADGKATGNPVVLNAASGWTYTWTNLDKYANGSEIAYTVAEVSDDALAAFYTTSGPEYDATRKAQVITNTHEVKKVTVKGVKQWSDANNQDGKRPETITVDLLANGSKVKQQTVVAGTDGTWSFEFTDLDKYANGAEIVYTVTEEQVEGYKATITGDAASGFVIDNAYTPEETEVTVTKAWDDADDQDGIRPDSITVRLLANGSQLDVEGVESEVQLTQDNAWTYTWTGLSRYQDGEEISYSVEEDATSDYAAELTGSATSGFTLKNTHAPALVDVSVDKVWADAGDQDGARPDSVEVQLRAVSNGELVSIDGVTMKATLNAGNNWHYEWADLPQKHNGAPIAYSLVELGDIEGYTSAVTSSQTAATQTANSSIAFTVTNTHAPELVNIPASKAWDDANNQDGKRPTSIGVQLYADGEPALVNGNAATATLSAANGWATAWNNLPKYANGTEIAYSVVETAVPAGYEKVSDGTADNAFTLTNKHETETTDVSAKKVWNDADNQDGMRGAYVTVELYANGEKVQSGTLNDENDWSITWEGLPKYANGVEIDYTLAETAQSVPAGYTAPAVAKSTADGAVSFTVTNTHTPETVEVRGAKTWNDANNQDGVRPTSITVNLLKNGEQEDSVTVRPDASGNWTYAFTGLPKYEAGEEIAYAVSEEAIEGYTTVIDGYDITNSYKPGETDISVVKAWDDANNQDGVRPASVKVQLYANGEASGDAVTLNAANDWSYTWEGLAKKSAGEDIAYTVAEVASSDWSDDYDTEVTGDMQNGFTITNTHAPEKTTAKVTKIWDDADDQDGKRPAEISVQLLANGQNHGAPVTLNEQNDWSFTWTDLDKKENGVDITYTLAEVSKTAGYTTEVEADGTVFTVTNAHEVEYIDIPVTKEWDDNDDQDGLRPKSIVVKLMNGDDEVDTLTLSAANGWTGSFTHLPKYANGSEIAYALEEVEVDGYDSEIEGSKAEGFTVTNSHTPAVTSAQVLKSWNDANNQDGKRPASITVQLLANDGAYGEPVTLSAANGWAYQWDNLPLKQNGEVVDYAVTESGVPDDYTASVEGDRVSGFVITDSYTPGVRNITVAKAWDDADDQDGVRADSIKVRLLADGEQVDADGVAAEVELNAGNHWTYTWENLDQMKAGQDIAYTVEEVEVPEGYRSTTSGSAEEGYVITNAHTPEETTFSVSKEWDDDENRDGVRPAGIALTLYADAQPVASQTVVPDASGNWSYTFEHLPKYASGAQIAYTVDEQAVSEYTGSVEGTTLTNSHDNEKTSVAGKKTWNDNDNQDSTRPDSIIVRLFADGEEVDAQEVKAADNWAYEFSGLNKFRDGGTPIVYTVEEDAVRNYTAAVDGYDIANTLNVGSLTVAKSVRNTTTSATFSFTVTLDDQKVNGVHGGMEFTNGVATFELADGERIVATDLPAGVSYTVEETDRAGYESTSTGSTGMIATGQNATASFVNAYSATGTAEFFAMKTLNGRTLGPDEFTFQLLENGQVLQTVKNAGDGHARFEAIEYTLDDLGEHTYTVREVKGNARGVTYDDNEYTVTTNVTDNGDGTLNVEYGEYNPDSGVPFKNSYAPSGSVELEVGKLLDGQAPAAGAYTFQVADAQGKVYATATNDANGKVKFPALTFKAAGTYVYKISEVVPEGAQRLGPNMIANGVAYDASTIGVTIEAYDNFDGTMRFETTYDTEDATFNNTSVPDTTFPLTATKAMEGRAFTAGDSFTFTVEGEDGAPMPANRQVTITPTSGTTADIDFGDITFTADDLGNTYTYTIKETPATGDTRGVTYDPFGHWVKLTVGDAGDGTMNVTAQYQNDADGITLTNTYAASGEAVLSATKTLSGRALSDGEFFFELEGDNLPATMHASAAADGTVKFAPIAFTQADVGKTFHYTMTETQGTLGGVTYDASSYDIALSVADNGDGTLAITYDYGDSATAPVFENTYEAAGTSAQLTAHKALVGGTLEGGEFTFQLSGVSANAQGEDQTATNDADGMVSFDSIEFADAGVYQYRISEVVPSDARDNGDGTFTGADGIVYDGRSHTATVTVTDDGYGALHAAVAYDQGATGISFGNTELVRTGFAFNKYFFGGVGTFDFTMTAVDAQGNVRQGSVADYSSAETIVDDGIEAFKATVQNGAFEGDVAQIVFPQISFVSDGDYYYLVEEEQSDDPTVVIDEAKYLVHVVVENNQVASTTYNLIYAGQDFGPTTDLSFYNNSAVTLGFASQSIKAYSEAGQRVSVYPEAQKYLNGSTDQLVGDDFTFELIDEASGTVLAQATNDEFGKIAFYDKDTDPGLVYDEPGVYRYIMREVAGDEANVEYDTSSISMTVSVVQDDEGLKATTTYNGPGGAEPAFYNVKRGMDVTVQKVSRYGGEGLVDCTYALWMVGQNGDALIKEATSDANGYITFTDVTLIAGQKYYFKEVEAPKGHTVDPYRTAYFSLNETGDGLVLVEATAADGWHSATENIELDKARQ